MKRLLPILLILIFTIPTIIRLNQPGIFPMHDDISVMRQYQMDKCFQDGQIPCRWVPDMGYGYGYPQFNFYTPIPYYLGQIIHYFGFDLFDTVKIIFALSLILGNLAMYFAGSYLWGKKGGLISALLYAYLPYRASDLYSRGAMGEIWGMVFLPLIILFLLKTADTPNRKNTSALALSVAGLLSTHNLTTMMFAPFILLTIVAYLYLKSTTKKQLKTILIHYSIAALVATTIAGFYFLPVVFEARLVHTESLLAGYFNYLAHFIDLKQIFLTSFWGFGSSEIGPTDDLSFFLGPIHQALYLVTLLVSITYFLKTKQKKHLLPITLIIISLIPLFLTHQQSSFIWNKLIFLSYLQFPWRFLVVTNTLLVFSVGYLGTKLTHTNLTILAILIFLFNQSFFRPLAWFDQTPQEKLSGRAYDKQLTVSIFDYLPKTALYPPGSAAPISPQASSNVGISNYQNHSSTTTFTVDAETMTTITLPRIDFKGTTVYLDQKPIAHHNTTDLGLVTFAVPQGISQITVKMNNTPVRTLGNLLTLFFLPAAFYVATKKD